MPPPTPWMTRPRSITPIDDASADTSVPTQSSAIVASRTRSLPNMSPSLPAMGVATEALSRYAVRIHPTAVSEVPSSRWIVGRAGTTSDCISAYETPLTTRTARVTLWCWRAFGIADHAGALRRARTRTRSPALRRAASTHAQIVPLSRSPCWRSRLHDGTASDAAQVAATTRRPRAAARRSTPAITTSRRHAVRIADQPRTATPTGRPRAHQRPQRALRRQLVPPLRAEDRRAPGTTAQSSRRCSLTSYSVVVSLHVMAVLAATGCRSARRWRCRTCGAGIPRRSPGSTTSSTA